MKRWISLLLILFLMLSACSISEKQEPAAETVQPEALQTPEPVHVHEFTVTVTEQTCTQEGSTIYTCPCGAVFEGAHKPAPGHDYVDEVFEATIAADGFTRHTCTLCGDVVEDSMVPMLPDGIEDGSFFDDAVFVGDSILVSVQTYAMLEKCFGNATFLCRPGFSLRFVVDKSMKMTYRGRSMTIPEAVEACGANKVFIQFGMNDIATLFIDNNVDYWNTLIAEIRERCPDILIFIHRSSPIYREEGMFNNENMSYYNSLLDGIAEENGCFLIDTATPLTDENGFLIEEYCSDHYCHLSMEGCAVWERTLKDYLLEHKGEFA